MPAMSFNRGSSLTVLHLFYSLCLQTRYDVFRSELEQCLPLLEEPTLPTTDDSRNNAVLKVLQTEREKEKVQEEDDGDEIGGAAAADLDVVMASTAGQPQGPVYQVDDALMILVCNAVEEFGFAPRDVYDGVLNLPNIRGRHARVMQNLNYSDLRTIVAAFSKSRALSEVSHHIVSVHPLPCLRDLDDWVIDFKSVSIGRKVVELMRLEEDKELQHMSDFLHKISEGSTLAGWVFEARVHRMLSGDWESNRTKPQPIRMVSNHLDPPAFSIDSSSSSLPSTPDVLPSFLVELCTTSRDVTRVDFLRPLNNVIIDRNKYYIPTAPAHPLFDSFTITPDLYNRSVVISVFHITSSPRHEGSAKGYPFIRKIMARVRKLGKEYFNTTFNIEVAYFLICPEGGPDHKWQMPVDWNKSVETNDHRGDAFCVHVPSMSCPFARNFAV